MENSKRQEEIIFRPMNGRDLDVVAKIEQASFSVPWSRQAFSEELSNERARYIVGETAGEIVSYLGMWLVFGEADILNVAVHPKRRGRGIGRRMLEFALALAQKEGCQAATLEVRRSNDAAIALYAGLGFVFGGVRKNYYTRPTEDALLLWRRPQEKEPPYGGP